MISRMGEEKQFVYETIYRNPGMKYKERKFFDTIEGAQEFTKDYKDTEIIEHRVF